MQLRTLLLCCIALQLCFLYTVIFEVIVWLSLDDFGHLAFTDDLRLFAWLLAIVSISTVVLLVFLIFSASKYSHWQKSYLVLVSLFHLIICVPFYVSGIYLYAVAGNVIQMDTKIRLDFDTVAMFLNQDNKSYVPVKDGIRSAEKVFEVQKRYCCCGKDSPNDFKGFFPSFDHNSSVLIGDYNFTCPFFSSVGLGCAIVMLLVAPFLYSQFEMDRRRARAAYIRSWRCDLELKLRLEDQKPSHETEIPSDLPVLRAETRAAHPDYGITDNTVLVGYHEMRNPICVASVVILVIVLYGTTIFTLTLSIQSVVPTVCNVLTMTLFIYRQYTVKLINAIFFFSSFASISLAQDECCQRLILSYPTGDAIPPGCEKLKCTEAPVHVEKSLASANDVAYFLNNAVNISTLTVINNGNRFNMLNVERIFHEERGPAVLLKDVDLHKDAFVNLKKIEVKDVSLYCEDQNLVVIEGNCHEAVQSGK
ncbi:unnamed protein product [Caenorhabditis auriculariae]|uniref:Uncharacterized protein n=1 Tax=Caenorhabditis auriculariae TaxID=2777116 RepID=A0A8S1HLN3_9PELO|nr:unnamed protein product [Caenorhabditis auriculariae]